MNLEMNCLRTTWTLDPQEEPQSHLRCPPVRNLLLLHGLPSLGTRHHRCSFHPALNWYVALLVQQAWPSWGHSLTCQKGLGAHIHLSQMPSFSGRMPQPAFVERCRRSASSQHRRRRSLQDHIATLPLSPCTTASNRQEDFAPRIQPARRSSLVELSFLQAVVAEVAEVHPSRTHLAVDSAESLLPWLRTHRPRSRTLPSSRDRP
mmetsp:Transcript_9254/g.16676  ORF Transcript_9254/g.16676 Transcript_9254/m.16676 type:complete len:205 (-) Transcript_9254:718-1332(-)